MINPFKQIKINRQFFRWVFSRQILALMFSGAAMFFLIWFWAVFFLPTVNIWPALAAIPAPIRSAGRAVARAVADAPYFFYNFKAVDLPVYDIEIDKKDLKFLNDNLPKPTLTATLTDEFKESKKVRLKFDGRSYQAEMNYRGDAKTHWLWPKKSIRLKFSKNNFFGGQSAVNLIVPDGRNYLVEELNNWRAKKLGLVVPASRFVVVKINGADPAVYWEVEQINKEFLESAGLSSETDLYGEGDYGGPLYSDAGQWRKYTQSPLYNENNYSPLDRLLGLLNDSSDVEFEEDIFSILDEENFYAWNIQTLLAHSDHQNWVSNMRMYFDPAVGKLKIIPWDVGLDNGLVELNDPFIFQQTSNILANRILSFPEFMRARNERLWNYMEKNEVAEFVFYNDLYERVRVEFYQDKIMRFSNKSFDREVRMARAKIKSNFEFLRGLFTKFDVKLSVNRVDNANRILFSIDARSLSPLSLERISWSGDSVPAKFNVFENGLVVCGGSGGGSNSYADCDGFIIWPNIKPERLPTTPLELASDAGAEYRRVYKLYGSRRQLAADLSGGEKMENSQLVFYFRNIYTGALIEKMVVVN